MAFDKGGGIVLTLQFFESFKIGMVVSKLGWFDLVVIIILTWGIIDGFVRGFVFHFPRFIAGVVNVVVTLHFYKLLSKIVLSHSSMPPVMVESISFVLLALCTTFVLKLVIILGSKLGKIECEYFIERILGAVIGGLRYVLFFSLLLSFVSIFKMADVDKIWREDALSGKATASLAPVTHDISVRIGKALINSVKEKESV